MTARVFSGDTLPAVEKFSTGCIVRWDYEPIKTTIPETDRRTATGRVKASGHAAKNGTPPSAEEPQQGKEVDSGLVAYSEMRYIGVPDPERVVADIQRDLDMRYGEAPRPDIDLNTYRSAIAALNKE